MAAALEHGGGVGQLGESVPGSLGDGRALTGMILWFRPLPSPVREHKVSAYTAGVMAPTTPTWERAHDLWGHMAGRAGRAGAIIS